MRATTRFWLVAICAAALVSSPASAAHRKVLGVVVQTDRGRLDNSTAVTGADVYSCDLLDTDEGGALRVRIGSSQIYLATSSEAALEDDVNAVQALVTKGTVGFSEPASAGISVRTPAGIVRSAGGQAAAGEISFKGPKEMIVSAMRGDLVLDNGGELRTIPEGKSADVTFDDNLAQGCHDEAAADQQAQNVRTRPKIGFIIITTAAVAIPTYFLVRELIESDSVPKK